MSKNIVVYIVISLGILIIFSFIALIYGVYSKISTNNSNVNFNLMKTSLNLKNDEEIIDIDVIDKNRLLIKIEKSGVIIGGIFNIKQSKITKYIEK